MNHRELDLRRCRTIALSLADDARRRASVTALGRSLGLNLQVMDAVKCEPGHIGCGLSHLRALRSCPGPEPLLILEDDVAAESPFDPVVKVPEDADALYLGVSAFGAFDIIDYVGFTYRLAADPAGEGLLKVYNLLGAHAILYLTEAFKRAAMEAVVEVLADREWQHDKAMAALQETFNVYALRRPLFYQAAALQEPAKGAHQEAVTRIELEPVAEGTTVSIELGGQWTPVILVRRNGRLKWEWAGEAT